MDRSNGVWRDETIHPSSDAVNHDELYNSEESDALSSDSFSDGDYELDWSEKVGIKGNLFYIEAAESKEKNEAEDREAFSNVQVFQENCERTKSRPVKRIKNWVKRQKCKPSDKNYQPASLHRSNFLPMAAFKESQNSESEDVFLDVDPKRHNYGRRATLCEVLFGIVPRSYPYELGNKNLSMHEQDRRVIVHGFTPDGEAIGSGKIKIGDWLKSVNSIDVTMDTIGDILAKITTPQKVKLTIQRFSGHSNANIQHQDEYDSLLKQISGDACSLEDMKLSHSHIPHIVLYLTVSSGDESSANEDGVLYKFPEEESTLFSLKGMFITLNHMVADITSSPPANSTVIVNEQLVHVGYSREGREVMVLALPDCCVKSSEIQKITSDIARFMRFQYHTLGKALGDSENKAALDHFFLIFFHHYISRSSRNDKFIRTDSVFTDVLCNAQLLQLSAEIEVQLHTILNEFESSDFDDMSEAYYNARRLYTILGSCIFFKGFLLANHLPKEDLVDIFLYAKLYQLLELTSREKLSQVVIWREVFPTRQFHNCDKAETNDRDYRELDGRWFLLIVALKHTLLGILLEAGGASSRAQGNPSPDPFYVDQAQHTLLQVESTGVAAHVEKYLSSESTPQVASAEWFGMKLKTSKRPQSTFGKSISAHPTGSSAKSLGQKALSQSNLLNASLTSSHTSGIRKMQEVTSVLKKRASPDGERQQLLSTSGHGGSDSDTETSHSPGISEETSVLGHNEKVEYSGHTSASSDADSRTSSEGALYRSQKSHRIFASAYDLSSIKKGLDEADDELDSSKTATLVSGTENTLFHYMNIDIANGIFIAPTEYVQKWINGPVQREILDNFYRCCLQIHDLFQATLQHKEAVKNRESAKFGLNNSLNSVKEHGVLFHYTAPTNNNPRKLIPSIVYWVVGRLFLTPEPREVYVCFHDSAPQNVIEMGFRLGFGTSL